MLQKLRGLAALLGLGGPKGLFAKAVDLQAYLKKEKGLCGHDIGCDIRCSAASAVRAMRMGQFFDVAPSTVDIPQPNASVSGGANEAVCPPWYWKSASVWPEPFHEEIGGDYVKERLGARVSGSLTGRGWGRRSCNAACPTGR